MAGVEVAWNTLQPVDIGGAFDRGMQHGRQQRIERETRSVLSGYAKDPTDTGVVNALMPYNPQLAMQLQSRQRSDAYRTAASEFYGGATPTVPGASVGQQPSAGPAPSPQDAAYQRMLAADPEKAIAARKAQQAEAWERFEHADDAYSYAIRRLSGATDEDSYQRIRKGFMARIAPLGIDIEKEIPATYPGPEGIEQLRLAALEGRDRIAAQRLEWDIEDDEADNERDDRKTDSLITSRDRRDRVAESREARITHNGKSRGGGRRRAGGGGKPTATGPNGERVEWNGSSWEPIRQ